MTIKLLPRLVALCFGLAALPSLAADYTLKLENGLISPSTRGLANTTYFGWDSFGNISTPIDDSTPDILPEGVTEITGARFRTLNGQDHTSSTGNFYTNSGVADEEITVVTNGEPGAVGKTRVMVQIVTLFGGFPVNWEVGEINGVAPTVHQATNVNGQGQLWVSWELPGNQSTYTFTLAGAAGNLSFDKIVVDTHWDPLGGGYPDSVIAEEPVALASMLDQKADVFAPSSRGTRGTTYFGWDTFGPVIMGPPQTATDPIDDSTPDIGSDPTGLARFRTTNGQVHQLYKGFNLYLMSFQPGVELTLAEEITVPTNGVVGTDGFTTIILQISSSTSGQGGATFANDIFLGDIEGISPTVVQGAGSASALLWAKWVVPGNKPTYTITIDGVENQQHYSFEKVVVDTKYSRYAGVADTMREKTVEITTPVLADAIKGTEFSAQLEATGGAAPHTWTLKTGSSLPLGLELSTGGVISGIPVSAGQTTFTVVATSGDGYKDEASYVLVVLDGGLDYTLNQESNVVTPATRGLANSTYFGWDFLEENGGQPLNDTTPDLLPIGVTSIAGARFETMNGKINRASSGNYYTGRANDAEVNEQITVVTKGNVGSAGKTTVIVQLSSPQSFAGDWIFGAIAGVTPEVAQGRNLANGGQAWAKWVIPGNAASYTFTLTASTGAHMSFDKVIVDTFWTETEIKSDSMIAAEPAAINHVLEQTTGLATPSFRGTRSSSYYGWDGFGNITTPIDDTTPDILPEGVISVPGARFRTINSEDHTSSSGNFYAGEGTPSEEITIVTNGTPGMTGKTTVVVQLVTMFGGFPSSGVWTVSAINGVEPVVIQGTNAAGLGQLWAQWELPGNEPTYTFTLGATSAGAYSFDKILVDTKFNRYGTGSESMRPKKVYVTNATLANAQKGMPYSAQLTAGGGTGDLVWSLKVGSAELPEGLQLAANGLITGTAANLGETMITVVAEDTTAFKGEKTFVLRVVPGLTIDTTTLVDAVLNVPYQATLTASLGVEPYTWERVGDLPAGLSLSEDGVLSGNPTAAAAAASVTVKVTDAEESTVTKTFELEILGSRVAPVLAELSFAPAVVGANFRHEVVAANYPQKFVISGLPKGMTYDATTGVITGRTTLAGVYMVQVKASNTGGDSIRSGALVVKSLPVAQVGTYTGTVKRGTLNSSLGSHVTLTTTTTGAFTVKVKTGSSTKSAKGFLNGTAEQVDVAVAGGQLKLSLDEEGGMSGDLNGLEVEGWRQVWDKKTNPASTREGYYSLVLELGETNAAAPQGTGYATFSVAAAGTLKIAGKTADGQNLVASTHLGPNGEVPVYVSLYGNKGTVLGSLEVKEDAARAFVGNKIEGELSWSKPLTKGRTYAAAFGPLVVNVAGGYLAPASKGWVVMGLPELGLMNLEFADGGIEASATVANVNGIQWTEAYTAQMPTVGNAGKVALKINKATGGVSGSFTLEEATPRLVRKGVKFQGQVVRLVDGEVKAAGYFLLPQIPNGGSASSAPILSGSFSLVQEAPAN